MSERYTLTQYDVIEFLIELPLWEFEHAVRAGKVGLINKAFGLPIGSLARRARKQMKFKEAYGGN